MGRKGTLSRGKWREIVRRYRGGEGAYRIGREYGLSRSATERLLRERGIRPPSRIDRFWSHVDKTGGPDACWPWTAYRDKDGYGRSVLEDGKPEGAHRIAFKLRRNRDLPDGIPVLHNCDNPPCCNPKHLRSGSILENNREAIARGNRNLVTAGENHGMSRLTEQDVDVIRYRASLGEGPKAISKDVKIHRAHVGSIVSGKAWKHIPNPYPRYVKSRRPDVNKVCEVCGCNFSVRAANADTHPCRFCSNRCKGIGVNRDRSRVA